MKDSQKSCFQKCWRHLSNAPPALAKSSRL